MTNLKVYGLLLATFLFAFASCDKAEDIITEGDLDLNVSGLRSLGADHMYSAWIIVDGQPVRAGNFTANNDGDLSETEFDVNDDQLNQATGFLITIEQKGSTNDTPSETHILAGDFIQNTAALTLSHSNALGIDLATAQGKFLLATPTDGVNTNERSGVWFHNPGGTAAALTLPNLPAGWMYEGWALIDGKAVSTGKFRSATGADQSNQYSGAQVAPPFPGEDFLTDAPAGLTFPTDLSGQEIVVTIEPTTEEIDDEDDPFFLRVLQADVAATPTTGTQYSLTNQVSATAPTGTVMRNQN